MTATVVRAQRPTSVKAGDVALVLGDGTIEGFVGGVCAQQSVRVYALKAIETEEAVLLRIVPDGPIGEDPGTGQEVPVEDGAVDRAQPVSLGRRDRDLPRAGAAGAARPRRRRLADRGRGSDARPELGLELVAVEGGQPEPAAGDLALVVAAHGRDELHTLRRALDDGRAVRRPRREPQARRRRARRPARRRRPRRAARADRRARRDRHRRPHSRRDRAVDPRDDRRRAPRRAARRVGGRLAAARPLPAPPRRRSRSTRSAG